MRWNDGDQWIYSDQIVHPPIIDDETFRRAQEHPGRPQGGRASTSRTGPGTPTRCAGCCSAGSATGACKATGPTPHPITGAASPANTPWPTTSSHPLNVTLREDAMLGPLDGWLAGKFAPAHLAQHHRRAGRRQHCRPHRRRPGRARSRPDRRLRPQARPATGPPSTPAATPPPSPAGSPRPRPSAPGYGGQARPAPQRRGRMSRDEIASVVTALGDLAGRAPRRRPGRQGRDLQPARPAAHLPARRAIVRAEAHLGQLTIGEFDSVRGGT